MAQPPDLVFTADHLVVNKAFATVHQPGIGKITMVNIPSTSPGAEVTVCQVAPTLGQPLDEVLSECDFSDNAIREFREEKVVV